MPSVLAIISKAVFEKMVPKTVAVGDVVVTDRYTSSNAAFEKVAGDAIFLVTVRPPDEKLWLVGILEAPVRKKDAWVSAPNKTPIRDITSVIKKLKFATGSGITAKPGALGMSLQTPRILTEQDVALLRPGKTSADAYRAAVDEVPAAARARAQACAVGDETLRLTNYRRPFAMLAKLPVAQKKQLQQMATQNSAGKIEKLVKDEDWAPMELVDVVNVASAKVTHQLYVCRTAVAKCSRTTRPKAPRRSFSTHTKRRRETCRFARPSPPPMRAPTRSSPRWSTSSSIGSPSHRRSATSISRRRCTRSA